MSRYRRVIIHDSSSDDEISGSKPILDETQSSVSESDGDTNMSIQSVSCLLEALSFKKRNTYGHRVDRTDDEATSIDEDTYLEDSFVVKDYTSDENSNVSSDEEPFEKQSNRKLRKQKKTDKKAVGFSSFFKSDVSYTSSDEDKVSMLLDLYPELKENMSVVGKKLNSDSPEVRSGPVECDVDSDEDFEKYLEKVRTQSFFSKTYDESDFDGQVFLGCAVYTLSLSSSQKKKKNLIPVWYLVGTGNFSSFIMSDSESSAECSTEFESSSNDKSSNESLSTDVLKNTEGANNHQHHHGTPKNIGSEHPTHWHLPTTEKKREQGQHADLLLRSRKASNARNESRQDDDELFLLALSQKGIVHKDAQKYTEAKFSRVRKELTAKLFDLYRRRCFENKLNSNMVLEWNARLRLTAGRCRCKPNGTADIELSIKVCDTPERLRDTLLHEMCHAAVWVIDHIHKGGHGPAWKYWVLQCQKVFPSLPLIVRCHNYTVDAKYLYICDRCGQTIKRHSKSLDTNRKICGICQGHFILRSRDGKEFSTRPVNTFAQFVKENYKKERKSGVKHAEIMKILSLRFKEAIIF
uniref:SprT-like domain-containing protein n=1 Tax=Setaria digitata TaxID=48799 RepID=A0A915PJK1_9BILA